MCNFFSAIITIDSIIFDKNVDSHEILIEQARLDDTTKTPDFVRIEYVPVDNDIFTIDGWKMKIDQDLIPDWFDEDLAFKRCEKAFNSIKDDVIIINRKDDIIKNLRCFVKNSKVVAWKNSKVEAWENSIVEAWGNSIVRIFSDYCEFSCFDNAIIIKNNKIIIANMNLYSLEEFNKK